MPATEHQCAECLQFPALHTCAKCDQEFEMCKCNIVDGKYYCDLCLALAIIDNYDPGELL